MDREYWKNGYDLRSILRNARKSAGPKTVVDLVFLIDATRSMQNALDAMKMHAMTLYEDIIKRLSPKGRVVSQMRVKVIVFRDVYADAEPFQESEFFVLQENGQGDEVEFYNYVSNIRAEGGGDEPDSALEALHLAMNVDYVQPLLGQRLVTSSF